MSEISILMSDPKFVELAIKVMEMEAEIDEDMLLPFTEDDEDENGNKIVKTRKGDYGNMISYVPSKYVRERFDKAFNRKWSFFIYGEQKEDEPVDKWSKKDEEYVDGDKYIKCIGMMIIPGLGIRMEYGTKKIWGATEASDWKACKTDAFKKCCEAFGIYMDYDISDDEESDEEDDNSSKSSKGKKSKLNLDDIEYTDDELEEALETTVDFGKYDGSTLSEIYEDDEKYIEWLAKEARDEDLQFLAKVILKYNAEQEAEKSSRRNKNNRSSKNSNSKSKGKSSSSRRGRDEDDEEEDEEPKKSSKGKSRSKSKDDDDEKEALLDAISEELENYDKVQARGLISSSSISSKYPKGKTKLNDLTLNELRELADVLEVEV